MPIYPEIEMGARVAKKIKELRYPELSNSAACMKVARDLSALKKFSRPYYPGKDDLEVLRVLSMYDDETLLDSFRIMASVKEDGALCKDLSPQNGIGKLIERSMGTEK